MATSSITANFHTDDPKAANAIVHALFTDVQVSPDQPTMIGREQLTHGISNVKVEALRDDFLTLLPRNLKALFYRTVTILNVDKVVPVPDGAKLVPLHDWLGVRRRGGWRRGRGR